MNLHPINVCYETHKRTFNLRTGILRTGDELEKKK